MTQESQKMDVDRLETKIFSRPYVYHSALSALAQHWYAE